MFIIILGIFFILVSILFAYKAVENDKTGRREQAKGDILLFILTLIVGVFSIIQYLQNPV